MNGLNISDLLCDLYDIREMGEFEGFGTLPKDNEGTETTIFDCLDNCIMQLERELEKLTWEQERRVLQEDS